MNREQKEIFINNIKTIVDENSLVLVFHYRGMSMNEMTDLRVQSFNNGCNIKVTNNRLAKLALKETNKAIGTIIARGAAGGALTNEGSLLTSQIVSLREGAEDFSIAAINQEITQNLGIIAFNNAKIAGKQAMKMGYMNAIFGLGTDIATASTTGMFDPKPTTTDVKPT